MDVHIPEAGNEVSAASVDVGRSIAGIASGFAWAGVEDFVSLDYDDLIGVNLAGADVDDVSVSDDDVVLEGPMLRGERPEEGD